MHTKYIERAFAPRRQAHQRFVQLHPRFGIAVVIKGEAFNQVDACRHQFRQGLQRALPALQVAVTLGHFGIELRLQTIGPFSQRGARQAADQRSEINHGRAINEAKLRH